MVSVEEIQSILGFNCAQNEFLLLEILEEEVLSL